MIETFKIEEKEIKGQNVVTFKPQPGTITFSLDYKTGSDGELYLEDGIMKFKGDVDKSAEVLFNAVCNMWNVKVGI